MTSSAQDVFSLARKYLPDWKPGLIFDVGANVGQTAGEMVQRAPEARIHAFEPFPDTYRELVANMQVHPNVVPHNLALGRAAATLNMEKHRDSRRSRLLPDAGGGTGSELVEVQVRTGAEVLRELGAPRIDILKIDTEGHDYDVLIGFLPVIDQVDFIQVEAAMNPYNTTHVPLRRFEDLLWHLGFHLFHIFDQKMEWKRGGRPVLRRCNPVFINGRLVSLNKIN